MLDFHVLVIAVDADRGFTLLTESDVAQLLTL
jgi:hypothetical protein